MINADIKQGGSERLEEVGDKLYLGINILYDIIVSAWLWKLGHFNLSIIYALHIFGYLYYDKKILERKGIALK